jgi:hypothetical protein
MALNITINEKFKKAFEQKCFSLIVEAYQKLISEKIDVSLFMENDISAILNKNIELNIKSIDWQIFSKTENYIQKDNQVLEKGFADKLSRIDFVFSVFNSTNKYEYFIEAKNLKEKDSALKRRYINTGIDNFTTKKYENGSLVGYLLKGNLNKTIQGINSLLIKKDKRNSEILISKKNDSHKDYFESEHIEIGVLKHLIFDFTNMSN